MNHEIAYNEPSVSRAPGPVDPVTTYLICRNTLLRTGFGHLLSGSQFVMAEETVKELSDLSTIVGQEPALVLLGESLTVDTCIATLETLRIASPSARLVMMADDLTIPEVVRLCQAGLGGLCPTAMPRSALLKALELVMLGETFLPAAVSFELLLRGSGRRVHGDISAPADAVARETGRLTSRETQILRCLTRGASNKIIARELGCSEATVKVHVKGILRKVKAANRTQAAMWAQEHMTSALSPDGADA